MQRVSVETKVLLKNEEAAACNRRLFEESGIAVVNLMSAPGAGKTSLLEKTIPALREKGRIGVIEGDLFTDLDASRMRAAGVQAHQINTGTCCHLDARMVHHALSAFPVEGIAVLCIENVGNLVCPAEFDLGEHLRVMVFSVTEGADKPQKYPLMFHCADAVVLNKTDLLPYCGVSLEELETNVRKVNPKAPVFPLSCRTGEGLDAWTAWLQTEIARCREAAACA